MIVPGGIGFFVFSFSCTCHFSYWILPISPLLYSIMLFAYCCCCCSFSWMNTRMVCFMSTVFLNWAEQSIVWDMELVVHQWWRYCSVWLHIVIFGNFLYTHSSQLSTAIYRNEAINMWYALWLFGPHFSIKLHKINIEPPECRRQTIFTPNVWNLSHCNFAKKNNDSWRSAYLFYLVRHSTVFMFHMCMHYKHK